MSMNDKAACCHGRMGGWAGIGSRVRVVAELAVMLCREAPRTHAPMLFVVHSTAIWVSHGSTVWHMGSTGWHMGSMVWHVGTIGCHMGSGVWYMEVGGS